MVWCHDVVCGIRWPKRSQDRVPITKKHGNSKKWSDYAKSDGCFRADQVTRSSVVFSNACRFVVGARFPITANSTEPWSFLSFGWSDPLPVHLKGGQRRGSDFPMSKKDPGSIGFAVDGNRAHPQRICKCWKIRGVIVLLDMSVSISRIMKVSGSKKKKHDWALHTSANFLKKFFIPSFCSRFWKKATAAWPALNCFFYWSYLTRRDLRREEREWIYVRILDEGCGYHKTERTI